MSAFVSHAQNGEDVVLWRALGSVSAGHYVEVGANHPSDDSVTRAFYNRGWSGVTIEPVPYFADLQRAERPRDHLVQAAITSADTDEITLHVVPGTGLSTIVDKVIDRHAAAGIDHVDLVVPTLSLNDVLDNSELAGEEIHFMVIDVEGAEHEVLRSVDLKRWRPWVLVVESTEPNSTVTTNEDWEPELLACGYEFCLFDGLSRFYVAAEKSESLRAVLSYPACILDNYQRLDYTIAVREHHELLEQTTQERAELLEQTEQERQELLAQTMHWRTVALTRWADTVSHSVGLSPHPDQQAELAGALTELSALQRTVSWRLTRPLRDIRRVANRTRRR